MTQLLPSAPASVERGALESNTVISTFQEQSNFLLTVPIPVDITTSGTFTAASSLTPGTLSAGTLVNSYFMSFDPVGAPRTPISYSGWIAFGEPVIGIEVRTGTLLRTSPILGASGTLYPPPPLFGSGLELSAFEGVYLSPNRQLLHLAGSAGRGIDQIRIITAAIPEPESLLSAGFGLLILGFAARRRLRP